MHITGVRMLRYEKCMNYHIDFYHLFRLKVILDFGIIAQIFKYFKLAKEKIFLLIKPYPNSKDGIVF